MPPTKHIKMLHDYNNYCIKVCVYDVLELGGYVRRKRAVISDVDPHEKSNKSTRYLKAQDI